MNQYIYLISSRSLNTNIYKIGMSKRDILTRLSEYKGDYKKPIIKGTWSCYNAREIETDIIKKFNNIFIKQKGNEYFEGDINIMINIIQAVAVYYNINYMFVDNKYVVHKLYQKHK